MKTHRPFLTAHLGTPSQTTQPGAPLFTPQHTLLLSLLLSLSLFACNRPQPAPQIRNWVWATPGFKHTQAEWTQTLKDFKTAGIDAILIENHLPEGILEAGKEADVEIHLWWWAMNRPGDKVAEQHPEWYSVNRLGESCYDKPPYVPYYKFLCPSQPAVREHIKDLFTQACAIEGLKGISLDYIRYSDAILPSTLQPKYDIVQDKVYPQWDFCYCDHCRAAFKELTGVDPLDLEDPSTNKEWLQFRWDAITTLVNELVEIAHAHGKVVSASVFPSPELSRQMVVQDWSAWNLDYVMPMIYHHYYAEDIDWIGACVADGVREVNGRYPVYAGVLPRKDDDLVRIREIVLANGGRGISVFSAGALTPERLAALAEHAGHAADAAGEAAGAADAAGTKR